MANDTIRAVMRALMIGLKNMAMKEYSQSNFVLLYQMGKVGSMAIGTALKNQHYKVWHVHTLGMKIIDELIYRRIHFKDYYSWKQKCGFGMLLLKNNIKLRIAKRSDRLKVITIVRNPISRNESFYMQTLHLPLFYLHKKEWDWSEHSDNTDRIITEYFDKFNHTQGITWFDQEMKRYLGVDVYAYPFDKEKGYAMIQKDNLEILVIKLEKLNDCAQEAFQAFLGLDTIELTGVNVGSKKWYGDIYREFQNRITYPRTHVNQLYNSQFMRHFYSDDEIAEFMSQLSISK